MVEGVVPPVVSNPIPTRDAQGAQTKLLCAPGDPIETESGLPLSVSCGGRGQQWSVTGAGALGAADLGMA